MTLARLAPLLASLVACVSQPTSDSLDRSSATPERPTARRPKLACAELPADTLLILEQSGCPIALVRMPAEPPPAEPPPAEPPPAATESEPVPIELALVQVAKQAGKDSSPTAPASEPLARGPAPLACGPELQRCSFEGVVDPTHGPVLLVLEQGHESEHPVQVYVGVHEAGRLAFVPSWVGPSSVVDHTRVGPAFALAPHDCAGELRLLPVARLPEAEGELAPADLVMLAGRWTVGEGGLVAPPQRPSPSLEGCKLLLAAP